MERGTEGEVERREEGRIISDRLRLREWKRKDKSGGEISEESKGMSEGRGERRGMGGWRMRITKGRWKQSKIKEGEINWNGGSGSKGRTKGRKWRQRKEGHRKRDERRSGRSNEEKKGSKTGRERVWRKEGRKVGRRGTTGNERRGVKRKMWKRKRIDRQSVKEKRKRFVNSEWMRRENGRIIYEGEEIEPQYLLHPLNLLESIHLHTFINITHEKRQQTRWAKKNGNKTNNKGGRRRYGWWKKKDKCKNKKYKWTNTLINKL